MDNESTFTRRRAITLLGGAGVAALVGCAANDTPASPASVGTSSSSVASRSSDSTAAAATTPIAEETEGPFPGDGSNGPNVLTQDGVVRRDITSSFGSSSGTASGVPTTIELSVTNLSNGNAPFEGAAVYIWHCDRDGNYSLYSTAARNQNYLRGVQVADANGTVTFDSIFPACYSGRWPHVHFEVYPTLAEATSARNKLATSQIAIPKDICDAVYATSGYEQSVRNLQQVSLTRDMVFADGVETETPTVTGSPDSRITLAMPVAVRA
jgi:protocatechuate 3,4-dioxygenase beta subunit